uniref:SPARC-related modular calcium-binding protein 1-like n=1 Tax=Myxine glutinosa TaxID=7769 RepID=UPI00358E5B93
MLRGFPFTTICHLALLLSVQVVCGQRAGLRLLIGERGAEEEARCSTECADGAQRPLCASDGRTFQSPCDFQRAKCKDPLLKEEHDGHCEEMSRCQAERKHAAEQARRKVLGVFIPQCSADGSYAPIQCHNSTGYCWCVTPSGRPIGGTSVHNGMPTCSGAPSERRTSQEIRKHRVQALQPALEAEPPPVEDEGETGVPSLLNSQMYLVQKPDGRRPRVNNRGATAERRRSQGIRRQRVQAVEHATTEESTRAAEEVTRRHSCNEERRLLAEQAKERPWAPSFLPECTDGGLYHSVQCHQATRYCWCVLVDTGRPIPGTSKQDEMPNCDSEARVAQEDPFQDRRLQGCPRHRKTKFITSALDVLTTEMVNAIVTEAARRGSNIPEPDPEHTLEEQALRWHFARLDRNRDGFLRRQETKPLRRLLRLLARPKKCVRRFSEYCDLNVDRRLSLTELHGCLGISSANGKGDTSSTPGRHGSNPLGFLV